MTDITELAQSLRRRAASANEFGEGLFFIKADDVLALVETLEKAKTKADIYDMLRDDYGLREKDVGLVDFVDWQANRIAALEKALEKAQQRNAELESRTVKLPQRLQPGADGYDDWYVHSDDDGEYLKVDDVLAMLTAAGIKVEAE
ncbi:TPA: ead/Ea22-like family protein [Klebsiella pneumoniae]